MFSRPQVRITEIERLQSVPIDRCRKHRRSFRYMPSSDGTLIKRISLSACSVVSIHCRVCQVRNVCRPRAVRILGRGDRIFSPRVAAAFHLFLRAPGEPRTAACRSGQCAGFVRYRAARMRMPRRRLRCITGSD